MYIYIYMYICPVMLTFIGSLLVAYFARILQRLKEKNSLGKVGYFVYKCVCVCVCARVCCESTRNYLALVGVCKLIYVYVVQLCYNIRAVMYDIGMCVFTTVLQGLCS
jgi:hypothetical protein